MTGFVDRLLALVERLAEDQPVILAVDEGDGYIMMAREVSPAFALHVVRAILSDLSYARRGDRRTDEDLMVDGCLAVLERLEVGDEE